MVQKKRKGLRRKIKDSRNDPDKRNRLIDIARKNTVNTKAFRTRQSFGPAGPVRHIDPSEYKFKDDDQKQ
jgi:hypothetical protein